jgi:pseudouridylate synthase
MNKWWIPGEETEAALKTGQPVLALESSVIAQGMPRPRNLESALELTALARSLGVTPAIVCVLDGMVRVGITDAEIERLAYAENVRKVSTRELPSVVHSGVCGATTVAATMRCAAAAGIGVFSTGGIGGVHRQNERWMDVSADLPAFTREPVIVVSAGAKAILDLPRTVEMLETLGIPMLGYRTDRLPAFYSAESDIVVERIDSAADIARRFLWQNRIQPGFGLLVANPIPREAEIPFGEMEGYIGQALAALEIEQSEGRVTGPAVTPFLLREVNRFTGGRALEANVRLLRNNVMLGCEIALAWSALGENDQEYDG